MSSPQAQQQQQQRRRRNTTTTTGIVTRVAATAVVAYGAYRAALYYFDNTDDNENIDNDLDLQQEEDNDDGVQQQAGRRRKATAKNTSSNSMSSSSRSSNSSWLAAATDWVVDTATSSVIQATAAGISSVASVAAATREADNLSNNRNTRSSPRRGRKPWINRRQRLAQCRQKTLVAFKNCLPFVQPVIEERTNTSQYTKRLKEIRRRHAQTTNEVNKHQQHDESKLWQKILIETTTRMLCTSYAYTLLMLSLTVQLHYIGYRMMMYEQDHDGAVDGIEEDDEMAVLSPVQEEAQTLLLETHDYFINDGLPLLITTVRRSVETVLIGDNKDDDDDDKSGSEKDGDDDDDDDNAELRLSSWTDPTNYLTQSQIEEVLYVEIPNVLSRNDTNSDRRRNGGRRNHGRCRNNRRAKRNWMRFVWPEPYSDMMDEIWDIGSSPVWDDAQQQLLEKVWYDVLRDRGWSKVFLHDTNGEDKLDEHRPTTAGRTGSNTDSGGGQPMAKVMAQFKKTSTLLFDIDDHGKCSDDDGDNNGKMFNRRGRRDAGGGLAGRLQSLPTVLELADVSFGDDY